MEAQKLIYLTGINSGLIGEEPALNSFGEFLLEQEVLSSAIDSSIGKIVCIDYTSSVALEIKKLGLGPKDCTLVRMEPSVVLNANYARSRHRQFSKLITVGGCNSRESFSVPWPLVWPSASELEKLRDTERVERVVVINSNKMSFIVGELYSLRRKSIKAIGNLDLYGNNWDSKFMSRLVIALKTFTQAVVGLRIPRPSGLSLWFQSYPMSKGPVADKLVAMSHYKFALVIENSAEYMSEKLMESLFAGCIPIYVGPDPTNFGIPRDLVVCAEPTLPSIRASLNRASEWDLEEFHLRLRSFLNSDETRGLWDHKTVYGKMLEETLRSSH